MNATGMIIGARLVRTDHYWQHMMAQAETHIDMPSTFSAMRSARGRSLAAPFCWCGSPRSTITASTIVMMALL
jgi:hypothetical protein